MTKARGGAAALLISALALTACQSDADYFAQARADAARVQANARVVDLNPDDLMDQVCVIKLKTPARMTEDWRKFCERRGLVGA